MSSGQKSWTLSSPASSLGSKPGGKRTRACLPGKQPPTPTWRNQRSHLEPQALFTPVHGARMTPSPVNLPAFSRLAHVGSPKPSLGVGRGVGGTLEFATLHPLGRKIGPDWHFISSRPHFPSQSLQRILFYKKNEPSFRKGDYLCEIMLALLFLAKALMGKVLL